MLGIKISLLDLLVMRCRKGSYWEGELTAFYISEKPEDFPLKTSLRGFSIPIEGLQKPLQCRGAPKFAEACLRLSITLAVLVVLFQI